MAKSRFLGLVHASVLRNISDRRERIMRVCGENIPDSQFVSASLPFAAKLSRNVDIYVDPRNNAELGGVSSLAYSGKSGNCHGW